MSVDMAEDEVLIRVENMIGRITLNRPKALNALTPTICIKVLTALEGWGEDPAVRAVIVDGTGEKAFCAGGDGVAVRTAGLKRKAGDDGERLTIDFFRDEYRMNAAIGAFPKPYVSLLDGIVMGGGAGISVHGSHRLVTETTLFAMPECNIGLFPDVGMIAPLLKAPGALGSYAAMTGARLGAGDLIAMGLATHYVPRANLPGLVERILAGAEIDSAIEAVAQTAPEPALTPHRDAIYRCFSQASVEGILAALQAEGTDWAEEQIKGLNGQSPTSMKVTLAHLRSSGGLPLNAVLERDFRAVQTIMRGDDFYEGIRALLVDKDKSPKWSPASLADVTDAVVDAHFLPVPEGDLGVLTLFD